MNATPCSLQKRTIGRRVQYRIESVDPLPLHPDTWYDDVQLHLSGEILTGKISPDRRAFIINTEPSLPFNGDRMMLTTEDYKVYSVDQEAHLSDEEVVLPKANADGPDGQPDEQPVSLDDPGQMFLGDKEVSEAAGADRPGNVTILENIGDTAETAGDADSSGAHTLNVTSLEDVGNMFMPSAETAGDADSSGAHTLNVMSLEDVGNMFQTPSSTDAGAMPSEDCLQTLQSLFG